MRLYKIKLKGMGMNEFGPDGVWVTKDKLDEIMANQYDANLCNRVAKYGGRYFPPSAFETVLEEKELKDIVNSSVSVNAALLESLAEEGYLPEVKQACLGTGYASFVDKLVDGGKHKMLESTNEPQTNPDGLKRLEQLRQKYGLQQDHDV